MSILDKLNGIADDLQQGKGSAGKLLKDPALYNNANETIANVRKLTDDVSAGKGALGKLTKDPEFANKLQDTINKISAITDRLEAGEGSAGMLLKDPALFNNTNQLLVESRELIKAVRENPKKYLTITLKVF
jgi:phospholipid/cholesterol/gamma-HCH transport system substrate-binding protein